MSGDGVEDSVYVNFFGVDGEAAMLACDMYGLLPENLLYQPKSYFIQTGDETEQIVLVRYTMCERSRQGTFRTLLGAKAKLLREGMVDALWKERRFTLPDAPRCPRFSEAQLMDAAGTLDTDSESDDERMLDERGMLKPPPPPPPKRQQQQRQPHETPSGGRVTPFSVPEAGETSLGVDGHLDQGSTGAATMPSAEAPLGVPRTPMGADTPPPLCTPSSPHKDGSDDAHSEGDATGSGTVDEWRRIHALEKLVIPRPRKPATKAPRIPQAYFPRSHDTLAKEELELAETQKRLALYSSKASRRLHAKLKAQQSVDSTANHSAAFPPLTSSVQRGNPASGASSGGRGRTAAGAAASTPAVVAATSFAPLNPLQRAEERNRREVTAMGRVAQQQVRQLGLSYDQGRTLEEEMRTVPTLGTLEHMLKYQKSIGVTPEFDDHLQVYLDREDARETMRQETREAEWERQRAVEARDRRAREVLQREHERFKGVAAEVHRTQQLLTDEKQAAAQRQQTAHLNKVLRRTALRRAKADMYIETKRAAASMSRFNHDQQEMYRRQLRDDLRERQFRKDFADDYLDDDDDDGDFSESETP